MNHQCKSSTWYLKILQPLQHDSNWASLLETKMRLRVVYVDYPRERRANTKTESKLGEPGYRKNCRTYRSWAPGGLATADAERAEREESESDCGYLISIPAAIWRFWIGRYHSVLRIIWMSLKRAGKFGSLSWRWRCVGILTYTVIKYYRSSKAHWSHSTLETDCGIKIQFFMALCDQRN